MGDRDSGKCHRKCLEKSCWNLNCDLDLSHFQAILFLFSIFLLKTSMTCSILYQDAEYPVQWNFRKNYLNQVVPHKFAFSNVTSSLKFSTLPIVGFVQTKNHLSVLPAHWIKRCSVINSIVAGRSRM